MPGDLRTKVIVLTGASSGFGRGAALKFAAGGASLVLAARRSQLLERLARECENAGGRAAAVPTDVSREQDMIRLAQAAISQFGRIDVWINNAGAGAHGRFEEVPLAEHIQVIQTDLLGTLYGSYLAMQQFRRQNYGILINMASALGKMPAPYYSSYVAAKHGVVGLSAALRQELRVNGVEGIHVCTILPSSMDTPFFDHAANYTGHQPKPIPPLEDPEKVIDVMVRLVTEPEDEVSVGSASTLGGFAHQVAPGMIENAMAKRTHKTMMEEAPPAENTPGSLREPSPIGTGVHGGRIRRD